MDVGERVRRLRKLKKISQVELAERSGVGSATIARLEVGKGIPLRATIDRIAAALGVSGGELWGDLEEASPPSRVEKAAESTSSQERLLERIAGALERLERVEELQVRIRDLEERVSRYESDHALDGSRNVK